MVIVCPYMYIQTDVCGHTEISTHTTPKMYVSILMTVKNADTFKYCAASQMTNRETPESDLLHMRSSEQELKT